MSNQIVKSRLRGLVLFAVVFFSITVVGSVRAQPAPAKKADCYNSQEHGGTFSDCRSRFGARFVLGLGIDTFASGELAKVLNPSESDANDVRERFVGGFDVQYRLWRSQNAKSRNTKALWVRAFTLHGVRSSEVDCTKDSQDAADGSTLPGVCSLTTNAFLPADLDVGETATYILREASSLEGFGALRYEFRSLERSGQDDRPSGVLYALAQLGFLSVADSGDDLVDNHLFAIGAAATEGPFMDSFLELGWGRTQLYGDKSDDRFKVRALVSWKVAGKKGSDRSSVRAFASIVVDSDFGSGSDSVQSYIGLSFDVSRLSL